MVNCLFSSAISAFPDAPALTEPFVPATVMRAWLLLELLLAAFGVDLEPVLATA